MFDVSFELAIIRIRVAIRVPGIALGLAKDSSTDESFVLYRHMLWDIPFGLRVQL